jgi:hypothetical protein
MEKRTRNLRLVGRDEVSLGELIHQAVRRTIEQAVEEELHAALGRARTSAGPNASATGTAARPGR